MKKTDKKEFANGKATIIDRNSSLNKKDEFTPLHYVGINKENGFL